MTLLSELLTSLFVDVLPERGRDPVVEARATRTAKRLAVVARSVHGNSAVGAPDADPSIALVASIASPAPWPGDRHTTLRASPAQWPRPASAATRAQIACLS